MITLLPPDVSCRIFTFRDGALSTLAHDLELEVQRMTLSVSDDLKHVEATFDPTSLRVCKPALSDKDRHKIETTIVDVILQTRTHARIAFETNDARPSGSGYALSGALDLHGVKRNLSCQVSRAGDTLTAEITLQQTDFGIAPYSVMLGAMRVRNDLRVVVRVAEDALRKAKTALARS